MLKHLCEETDRTYVSLDNMMARELAQTEPVLFFQTYKPPILIDEVQKAPELFEQIKIMRDVAEEGGITDIVKFIKFLKACSALVSDQVNYATLAESTYISEPTAKEWLKLLQGLEVVYLLEPYANNELKRLSKTPKLYFCDTGLCAFLSMWNKNISGR